ncbi:MAG: LysM peptidoglycan-binding domain-containing protein, partial [Chloroflexota bacterium]
MRPIPISTFLFMLILLLATNSCASSSGTIEELWTQRAGGKKPTGTRTAPIPTNKNKPEAKRSVIPDSPLSLQPPTHSPNAPHFTPTADLPHNLPTLRNAETQVIVQSGNTLKGIARLHQVSVKQIVTANQITNPDLLQVGQVLTIPIPNTGNQAPDFKIIPDSELVYGPYSATFDIQIFINQQGGYLAKYQEDVIGKNMSGSQILERVARENSVNPRLLLAILEYQSGWVTNPSLHPNTSVSPLGFASLQANNLYQQLSLAANELNRGYYLWKINGIGIWILNDDSVLSVSPVINAGTAGIQAFFAEIDGRQDWEKAISPVGLFATYQKLFGNPFDFSFDPVLPPDLKQPDLQLPFEKGTVWAFTGGPHSAWTSGSAWAALDFAPPAENVGCLPSNAWVTAMADGLVVFSDEAVVIQDLDGDGTWQSGWSLLYMHVEGRERVQAGTFLKAGDPIGHPSCEGGVSTGTHVHITRRYNGEWISADGALPFILDGWVSSGTGSVYDGYLSKGGKTI